VWFRLHIIIHLFTSDQNTVRLLLVNCGVKGQDGSSVRFHMHCLWLYISYWFSRSFIAGKTVVDSR